MSTIVRTDQKEISAAEKFLNVVLSLVIFHNNTAIFQATRGNCSDIQIYPPFCSDCSGLQNESKNNILYKSRNKTLTVHCTPYYRERMD
jgi:hypothetical protein